MRGIQSRNVGFCVENSLLSGFSFAAIDICKMTPGFLEIWSDFCNKLCLTGTGRAEGALTKTARCWVLLPGVYAMCVCVIYCSTLMTSKRYVSPRDRGSERRMGCFFAYLVTLLRWIPEKTLQFFCGDPVYGSTPREMRLEIGLCFGDKSSIQ